MATPRLTHRQQAALARLVDLSNGVYFARGGWVPRASIGYRAAMAQLVGKDLVETTTSRGPLGNVRPVYRPRAQQGAAA